MSYLNPPYPNNFQELCAAMPLFYLDVFEMRAILRVQGRLLDGVCSGLENVVDFNFILTADDATVRMLEKALKITYKGKLTLDQRKRVIIGYIIGLGHIGEPEIRKIISLYTDFSVEITFYRGQIGITMDGIGSVSGYENLLETLSKRLPAHLGLIFNINIRSPATPVLRVGTKMAGDVNIGIPEGRDVFRFSDEVSAGAAENGTHTLLNVPEDTAAPHRVSILRTGGSFVMTAPAIFPTEEG